MPVADIAIATIFLISMIIGLIRGFLVEVLSILIWAAAFVASATLGPLLADWLSPRMETPSLRIFLAYASLFVGVLLLGALGLWLAKKLVQSTGLSGTDRLLGMVFGAARAVALTLLLVLFAGLTPIPADSWWRESRALPWFVAMADASLRFLPERITGYIKLRPDPVTAEKN